VRVEIQSVESDNENSAVLVRSSDTDSSANNDGDMVSNTIPTSREESDYFSVQPHSYLLNFNPDRAIESISGYIIREDGGKISQTALLDPVLPQNLISLAHAKQLGCTIEPHDEKHIVLIDFGNGETGRSGGQVTFEWCQGLHRKTFPVRCFVYDHDIRNLVFGKPFVERGSHYWPDVKKAVSSEDQGNE
jgi:hypothetical protein